METYPHDQQQATMIFKDAVAAVHPSVLVPRYILLRPPLHIGDHSFDLYTLPAVYVIGAGKAAAAMAASVEACWVNI